jgi:hypothetical protein
MVAIYETLFPNLIFANMGFGWSSLHEGADAIALQSSVVLKVLEKRSSPRISTVRYSTH